MSRTLTITIEEDWRKSLESNARRAMSGEVVGEILGFASADLFFSKLTPGRLALLRQVQGKGIMGVREIARLVGRDVRRVHDDIQILLELGLFEKTPDSKIFCSYDDIHVDMHLRAA